MTDPLSFFTGCINFSKTPRYESVPVFVIVVHSPVFVVG
jgi:hypothetical protein